MHFFLDESGELGFHPNSSRAFVIAVLRVENPKPLKRVIKSFNAKLLRHGWPQEVEVKAANVFGAPRSPAIPESFRCKHGPDPLLRGILAAIAASGAQLDVLAVNKGRINADLRQLPHGILYNYYAGQVLIDRIAAHDEVTLWVDKRNKELHSLLHFDGCIETEAFLRKGGPMRLEIIHATAEQVYGLAAADYVSWAAFRKYESGDTRFYRTIAGSITDEQAWFFG